MHNKWYSFFKATIGPWLLLLNRPTIEGADNVPERGPVIMVSNHQAVMDSLYLPLMMKRQLTFPAKKEYFTGTGVSGAVQRFFFSSVGQIPVDRESANAGDVIVEAAEDVLGRGDIFGIYPEGTRSPDGRLFKGRTGMARIAMKTGKPVIPVAMIGTRNANPIGSWILRPAKVRIKIGEPIDPFAWAKENGYDPAGREVARPFTDYVMSKLQALTGYSYVDAYASKVKDSLNNGDGYPEGTEPGGRLERRAH